MHKINERRFEQSITHYDLNRREHEMTFVNAKKDTLLEAIQALSTTKLMKKELTDT
jgi:hypothetical protein